MENEWKSLGVFDLTKAEMIRGILEEEGIESFTKGTTAPYADPVIFGQGGMVEIMVREDDYDRAVELIENFLEMEAEEDEGNTDEG